MNNPTKLKKLLCIKDPNPDYKKWIFNNLGEEVDSLPVYVGGIYTSNGCSYRKNKCWGRKQEYIYLSEMIEFGSFPKKYFADYEFYIDKILTENPTFEIKTIYPN